ncbi:MAG: hypothetical protein ACOYKZ_07545 [Chlamydiia bacterium]
MNAETIIRDCENCYAVLHPPIEHDKAFVWFTGIPSPLFNVVWHLKCQDHETASTVDEIITKAPSGMPLAFLSHEVNHAKNLPQILEQRGFQSLGPFPMMAWEVRPIDALPADIRKANLEPFMEVLSGYYQLTPELSIPYGARLNHAQIENYLLYKEGQPAAAASLVLVDNEVAGIFNDAPVQRYGRNMLPELMTFLMRRAHQLGLSRLVMWSSPDLAPTYRSLGFKEILPLEFYVR